MGGIQGIQGMGMDLTQAAYRYNQNMMEYYTCKSKSLGGKANSLLWKLAIEAKTPYFARLSWTLVFENNRTRGKKFSESNKCIPSAVNT